MDGFTLRHFSPVEFRCKCGCGAGMEKMDADLLHLLDEARDLAGTRQLRDCRQPRALPPGEPLWGYDGPRITSPSRL